jgi:hypothetical protein
VVASPEPTTFDELHGRLLRDIFGRDIEVEDALLLLIIFHYYRIELSKPQVLIDERRPDIRYRVLAGPLTLRRCAEALASVWSGQLDMRAEPSHWQRRWQDEWGGYTRVRRLSPTELTRLHELIRLLEDHPFVAQLHADGSQLFPSPA